MKTRISAFLLFLLLVDQSLLATAISFTPLAKGAKGVYRISEGKKIFNYKWWKSWKGLGQQKSSPPPPNAPPIQIDGLSVIKNYLYNYGYLLSSGPFNDSYDQETISAIQNYQKYFNLQVTGDLNNQTIQQLSLLRCDVPDINFYYNLTNNNNVSYPKAGNRWFPERNNLTYGFRPESDIPDNATKVFKNSFKRWANASGVLNLTETSYDKADIKVGFYNFTYFDVDDELYGSSLIILQPPSDDKIGYILLNANLFWALPSQNGSVSWEDGILDLESAAMHQIGHLLGLDHSNKNESVMYPYILPSQQRKVQLSDSDKVNIQQQYAHSDGSRLGVLIVTTLSVGFAYMLLMH